MNVYVTEKQRFYTKTWTGGKKLYSVQAYVYENHCDFVPTTILGTLREYKVKAWKELMSRPNVFYRGMDGEDFVKAGEDVE
jgi:hypothetical protein